MKRSKHTSIGVAVVVIAAIGLFACRKQKIPDTAMEEKNISYPAAYVVNGESSTLSVVRLSENTVTDLQ